MAKRGALHAIYAQSLARLTVSHCKRAKWMMDDGTLSFSVLIFPVALCADSARKHALLTRFN